MNNQLTLVTFDLYNVTSFVTSKPITLSLIKDHIESVALNVYCLVLDENGLFSDTLGGDVEEGRHYKVQQVSHLV